MSRDDFDKGAIGSFHELARQRGEGLLPELAEAMLQRLPESEVMKCEIITLPLLHERKSATMYAAVNRAPALVIEFPAPRWQRNANAKS
ncbi:hypothetical protein ASE36_11835 [Rhizobium sp. Root274]|uniref:hypothetical protein n=1 Tax=unclassified Rhizobium TaxID=2613769 RepID=UPI000715A622|nr:MULTISPECIES: hypothetical protein [unclassified Rhizobium]KQW29146.1 hypothetical protein ASC71_11855 [Rhizobium sp. Root1240]KRD29342.1 hypothetical protein ASE36_11835 [Rhizobium sp. Root274]